MIRVLTAALLLPGAASIGCIVDNWHAVVGDMHDGDQKEMRILSGRLIITPYGNNETWRVDSTIDAASCSAMVDFNVKGKPNPPPCSLNITLWTAINAVDDIKAIWEFTDQTDACKFGDPGSPLNTWIQLNHQPKTPPTTSLDASSSIFECPSTGNVTYGDMHDGDAKSVAVAGTALTIRPSGNTETWQIDAELTPGSCSASVDFNVPGKPSPPPCNLAATAWSLTNALGAVKHAWEFADPKDMCKFPSPQAGEALNQWFEGK